VVKQFAEVLIKLTAGSSTGVRGSGAAPVML